jgi:DNA-binding MarR family transcriptional regulator
MFIISVPHAQYLATTDFSLLQTCLEAGLSPQEYRILHYINSCQAHDITDLDLTETAEWLGLSPVFLELNLHLLKKKGLLSLDCTD